ncbi:spore coat protein U domain-containing protein [Ramlibacter sp. AN1015]|uniref:spore coat protein U domain-containing protein n=1 Tax=Ramlibacter sp. AN1015 TaxID=3133428 RepID=UPI0030C56340
MNEVLSALRVVMVWMLCTLTPLAGTSARAALHCGLSATSPSGTYSADNALTMDGSLTITCTRGAEDAQTQLLWLGLNQPPTGRDLLQQGGPQRLPYALYRARPELGLWTDTGERAEGDVNPGALLFTFDFLAAGSLSAQRVLTFNAHVAAGLHRQVGEYADASAAAVLRHGSSAGPVLASTLFTVGARIADQCRITPPAAPLALSYTAFSKHDVQGTASFEVTCTLGTPYTLALDPPSAVMEAVDIRYRLLLDPTLGQGTAQPQRHTITGIAPAGQIGRCPVGAGSTCRATRIHQIVVSY